MYFSVFRIDCSMMTFPCKPLSRVIHGIFYVKGGIMHAKYGT